MDEISGDNGGEAIDAVAVDVTATSAAVDTEAGSDDVLILCTFNKDILVSSDDSWN